jgi:hypothetical protein
MLMKYWPRIAYNAENELGADADAGVTVDTEADAGETGGVTEENGETAPPREPWFQKRIDRLTKEKHEAKRMADELRAELERVRQGGASDDAKPTYRAEDVELMAEKLADTKLFNQKCNDIAEQGFATYKDFRPALENLTDTFGQLERPFLEAVIESGAPVEVLRALGKDLQRAEKIMGLAPLKQAAALAKFAVELENKPNRLTDTVKAAAANNAASNTATTGRVVGGNKATGTLSLESSDLGINDWMKLREQQIKVSRA